MNVPAPVPEITPTELKAMLDSGDAPLLVDVREPFEAQIADLPELGQVRIPTGEFSNRVSELDRKADVVIYCRSGARSAWAAAILLERGFKSVLNLQGGILGWRAEVDPSLRAY